MNGAELILEFLPYRALPPKDFPLPPGRCLWCGETVPALHRLHPACSAFVPALRAIGAL